MGQSTSNESIYEPGHEFNRQWEYDEQVSYYFILICVIYFWFEILIFKLIKIFSYNGSRNSFDSFGGQNDGSSGTNTNTTNNGSNEFTSGTNPLAHLSESVNSLDPLNAMEKSLNDQVKFIII